jgi:hypothetical protein
VNQLTIQTLPRAINNQNTTKKYKEEATSILPVILTEYINTEWDENEEACGGGLGTSNMDRYELTSIEMMLHTHNTSWVEG